MENEYLQIVKKSRQNQQNLNIEQQKHILNLYKDAADDLKIKSSVAKKGSLTERWLKDYRKAILSDMKIINSTLDKAIQNNIMQSAQNASQIQVDLFDHLNDKYKLNMSTSFSNMFSSVPKDVLNTLVSGEFYKDGKGLSKRIWWNQQKVNGDIDYIIQKGILEKKSAYELAQDLQTYANPSAKKDWEWKKVYPKTAKTIDYNAQRLARTSISHAYTLSMIKSCEKNPFIEKVQWHSVFASGRTCPLCKARDKKIYTLKNCPVDHPNGMCYQTPLLEDSIEDIGTRLNKWLNGNNDNALDEWYSKYSNTGSSENLVDKKISTKQSNNAIIKENTTADNISKFLSNSNIKNRESLAKHILKKVGLDSIPVNITKTDSRGYCRFLSKENKPIEIIEYALQSNDERIHEYQIKTVFHEFYHANAHGLEHDINKLGGLNNWAFVDDTFAECAAHYVNKLAGIEHEIMPAYPDHLVKNLPKLKLLDEFKDCNTIIDFGEKVAKYRFSDNEKVAKWEKYYNHFTKTDINMDIYALHYREYVLNDIDSIVDKMLENMPNYNMYKDYFKKDLESAWIKLQKSGSDSFSQNEKMLFTNSLIVAMNRIGVK